MPKDRGLRSTIPMKLFFWRRKPQAGASQSSSPLGQGTQPAASPVGVIERSQIPTRPLAMPIEVRDALLRFALDCLVAGGARVRVEADDLISATLPDGSAVRYTTSLMRARAEDDTELLVHGGAALAKLLEECVTHAAVASLALEAHAEALAIARAQLAFSPTDCGRCAHHGNTELCQRCPLRADQIVLGSGAGNAAPRVLRQWTGRSIELTYSIVANDRHGRRDEDVRVSFDCETGRSLPLLTMEMLANARPLAAPAHFPSALNAARERSETVLMPRLTALGALLRLFAEHEYRTRLDDIQTTSQRLLRESPDEAAAIHEALERELERLGEVYAVDVDARLASVCFIERPMAAIGIPTQAISTVELVADLASGALLAPVCAVCGNETRSASLCDRGHLVCATCLHASEAPVESACPVCAGTSAQDIPTLGLDQADALSTAHLNAMSAATWRLFVSWLLEQDGCHIESTGDAGAMDVWSCRAASDDKTLLAGAIRFADCRALSGGDVERLVAHQSGGKTASFVLISTAIAGTSANEAARRLGVRLLDGHALADRLEELSAQHVRVREMASRTQEAYADAATSARSAMLRALQRAEQVLASANHSRRAAGRAAVVAATRSLTGSLAPASRALLAWETLASDWLAAFDDREARNGSLSMRSDSAGFAEMAERAGHLGAALVAALERMAETPEAGDLGYSVWRRDIMERLVAQCEACRWHIESIDPSQWREFTAAYDALAVERATKAATTASHAASRAARSYGELARRARIEEATA